MSEVTSISNFEKMVLECQDVEKVKKYPAVVMRVKSAVQMKLVMDVFRNVQAVLDQMTDDEKARWNKLCKPEWNQIRGRSPLVTKKRVNALLKLMREFNVQKVH